MMLSGKGEIKYLPASFLCALGSIDLLIDKQELIRDKVLKANGLCGSDTMDVSVRRQFKGKIFGFFINSGTFVGIYPSLHRSKRQP